MKPTDTGTLNQAEKKDSGVAMNLHIFSGTANTALSERISQELELPLGGVEIKRFPEGEIFVKYVQNIRGADVFIIQPTCSPPNENMMELLVMLDAARRASPSRITAVIPFYGYARQDRKDQPRVPITAKLTANLLVTAGADRILTMDLHAGQIAGYFDIPVDHLNAHPVIGKYLQGVLDPQTMVVAPDVGGVKMAQAYADMLGCGFAVVAKRRLDAENVESSHLVGEVDGRDCVMVDDSTTTGGTLVRASEKLKEHGANRVFAAVSHCCLTDEGFKRLQDSPITELITTDSVPVHNDPPREKLRILSISGLLGEAIRRIHEARSVSSLFRLS